MTEVIVGGRYRHFKENEYRVLHLALCSETMERLVVYQALYGEGEIWVRPLKMFTENVEKPGYSGPRFALIPAEDAPGQG